jgi:hypothetical protein
VAADKDKKSVVERTAEFLSRSIQAPAVVENPETGEVYIEPAKYLFEGEYAEEFERIARGASTASGIVPTPEDLTAQVMAQMQAAQEQQAQAAG